jgi:hypothetical protein
MKIGEDIDIDTEDYEYLVKRVPKVVIIRGLYINVYYATGQGGCCILLESGKKREYH